MSETFDAAKEGRRVVTKTGSPNLRQVSDAQVAADRAAAERQDRNNPKAGNSQESAKG